MAQSAPWWQTGTIYQIYPRSFADASGDGVGDLDGILAHLDHLQWLGVDAVWLSPIFPSPMADFGYDVADHCDIDPLFGDLATFDRLVAEAHRRGIRVVLDWVPNHTSDQHPWFLDARLGPDSPHRDWYVWRSPGPGGEPPNNWTASFAPIPTWTVPPGDPEAYLHLFLAEQPDLNWANPAVEAAMHDVLRFWLARGVDGFRADVLHCIAKPEGLPDDPEEVVGLPHVILNDVPGIHPILRRLRAVLDQAPHEAMMVGEVVLLDPERVARYYGDGDELHLAFNFAPFHAPWDADQWRHHVQTALDAFLAQGHWPTWVLSNHDNPRHRTRYRAGLPAGEAGERSERRARSAAVLLLTLPGTPFLYAGEELGLDDAHVPEAAQVDPGGRDGCRAPLPWSTGAGHGFSPDPAVQPWLPFPPDAEARSVEGQRSDPTSMLHLYRRLLARRRAAPALHLGGCTLLDAPAGVLAYERHAVGAEPHTVLVNFGGEPVDCRSLAGIATGAVVAVASDGQGEGQPFSGTLPADGAVVLAEAEASTSAGPNA